MSLLCHCCVIAVSLPCHCCVIAVSFLCHCCVIAACVIAVSLLCSTACMHTQLHRLHILEVKFHSWSVLKEGGTDLLGAPLYGRWICAHWVSVLSREDKTYFSRNPAQIMLTLIHNTIQVLATQQLVWLCMVCIIILRKRGYQ